MFNEHRDHFAVEDTTRETCTLKVFGFKEKLQNSYSLYSNKHFASYSQIGGCNKFIRIYIARQKLHDRKNIGLCYHEKKTKQKSKITDSGWFHMK